MLVLRFVRALWCARNFDEINVFFFKGGYTIFTEEVSIRFSLQRYLYHLIDLTMVELPVKYDKLVE